MVDNIAWAKAAHISDAGVAVMSKAEPEASHRSRAVPGEELLDISGSPGLCSTLVSVLRLDAEDGTVRRISAILAPLVSCP